MAQHLTLELSLMDRDSIQIDTTSATALVRRLVEPGLTVTSIRKLYGGMVNRVVELLTDGEPASIVAKLNASGNAAHFHREYATLAWFADRTELPVPRPYAVIDNEPQFNGSGLLMQRIDGPTLADARLSPRGIRRFQAELAHHIALLHTHRRAKFGSALDPTGGYDRWLDAFAPMIQSEFDAVRDQLSSATRQTIAQVINEIDRWLDSETEPTLVHGDLWSTNILVDDRHPDAPRILAFIDGAATFSDPEYELAYLRLFRTATDDFFNAYSKRHQMRPNRERRFRVYWLNTMLLHVRLFGERYLPACDDLAGQIRSLK